MLFDICKGCVFADRSLFCRHGPGAQWERAAAGDPPASPGTDAGTGTCPVSASEHSDSSSCYTYQCTPSADIHSAGQSSKVCC